MANEQNLVPFTSEQNREEAKKNGQIGGIRSGEARRARKTLREELLMLLSEGDTQSKISLAQIQKALKGDTKAFETIRDTIGEKPIEKAAVATGGTIEEALKRVEGNEY